ncbi:hypothetical protein EYC84_005691 [Monilinia fructicola]|uniref:Uncharacterized protein n=1 Tax=Monilinia fructicola TaxID=38448 RepID=A0A5M9JZU6_MONFR|nr:hypothetical protein EYC84_005691 [Monilinia fructicola]
MATRRPACRQNQQIMRPIRRLANCGMNLDFSFLNVQFLHASTQRSRLMLNSKSKSESKSNPKSNLRIFLDFLDGGSGSMIAI